MANDVSKIGDRQKQAKNDGKTSWPAVFQRMNNSHENIIDQPHRIGNNIPGIPPEITSQINAKTGQEDHAYGNDSSLNMTQLVKVCELYFSERAHTQPEARPCKSKQHGQIQPQRAGMSLVEVKQICENIGRIGKKQQPADNTRSGYPGGAVIALGNPVCDQEGNPCQEKIPRKEKKILISRDIYPHQEYAEGKDRR